MSIEIYPIIRSLASYFLPVKILKRPGSGGTFSSEYCYSVWLRHLVYLVNGGLLKRVDDLTTIAEIGPGDSLGIGLSALYTGAKNYYALDVIKHANSDRNLVINRELFDCFSNRGVIPHGYRLRATAPELQDYSFPASILNYDSTYYAQRLKEIEEALKETSNSKLSIKYIVPWDDINQNTISNVDLIYSQAVMEHVEDIGQAYEKMHKFLKKGGIISHQIDFEAHEMSKEWNGHWYISKSVWKFLLHGRKYSINRLPLSAHIQAIENVGFSIKTIVPVHRPNKFKGLAPKVNGINFTEEDMITAGALIQAIKE